MHLIHYVNSIHSLSLNKRFNQYFEDKKSSLIVLFHLWVVGLRSDKQHDIKILTEEERKVSRSLGKKAANNLSDSFLAFLQYSEQ